MTQRTTRTSSNIEHHIIMNRWKTSDIKIYKDSAGYFEAVHKFAGRLIDWEYFESRTECRRAAVEVLKELKAEDELSSI